MGFISFVLHEASVDFSKQRVVKTEVFLLGYPNVTHVTDLYSQLEECSYLGIAYFKFYVPT